jgi:hypothetical protein
MNRAAEIAHLLGGARRNGHRFLARCCCHEDKTPSLSLWDGDDGELAVRCFAGCNYRDILAELRRGNLLDDRRRDLNPRDIKRPRAAFCKPSSPVKPADAAKDNHSDFAAMIWRDAIDPRGTLAEKYLNGRGIELADDLCGRVLRFHAHCPFGKNAAGKTIYVPALIVAFRPIRNDDETKPPTAIHRIGRKPDGSRIDRMMLGPVAGCAVKLDPDDNVEQGLGVCEGIETGLRVRARGWHPVWALGSAGAIQALEPIPGIEALTIFADNDKNGVGLAVARECARHWTDAGRDTTVRLRNGVGKDWADE